MHWTICHADGFVVHCSPSVALSCSYIQYYGQNKAAHMSYRLESKRRETSLKSSHDTMIFIHGVFRIDLMYLSNLM